MATEAAYHKRETVAVLLDPERELSVSAPRRGAAVTMVHCEDGQDVTNKNTNKQTKHAGTFLHKHDESIYRHDQTCPGTIPRRSPPTPTAHVYICMHNVLRHSFTFELTHWNV